jgi:ribosomal protein L11 methyltransferase
MTGTPGLTRLRVTVPAGQAGLALAEAAAALGAGCREAIGPDGEALLDFWVPAGAADPAALEARLAAAGVAATVAARPEDDAWRTAMEAFHRPVEVAGRLRVRPPWAAPVAGLLDVEVDPGMAFGTAQHATTRACLELLCGIAPGGTALDAGCGSGVLAVAARRLGWDPVIAVDHDPLSVAATVDNARRNGVALTVARRTIGIDRLPPAALVLANLTATVLRVLAAALAPAPPRRLIASGMRPREVADVAGAMAPRGLVPVRTIEDAGWATVLLERA